ncbi:hypothetical protein ACH5RR_007579 [Cinchona calisaya]|uniref:Uncharacterized protein n=1 Tax=Cinchona calisaya TaxID=153742 RepID=A0ABD3ASB3_9GENT
MSDHGNSMMNEDKLHNPNLNDVLHASLQLYVLQEADTNHNAMMAVLASNVDQSKGVLEHSMPLQSMQEVRPQLPYYSPNFSQIRWQEHSIHKCCLCEELSVELEFYIEMGRY